MRSPGWTGWVGLPAGIAAAVAVVAVLPGCPPAEPEPAQPVSPETPRNDLTRAMEQFRETVDPAAEVARREGERILAELESGLARAREELAEWRAQDLPDEARSRVEQAAAQLERDLARAESELQRLRDDGLDTWRERAPRIDQALREVAESFERLAEAAR